MVPTILFCCPPASSNFFTSRLLNTSTCRQLKSTLNQNARSVSRSFLRRQQQRQCVTASMKQRKRIGIVVIGNEILNGKTIDKNLSTLATYVESHGAILQKAVTIRDEISIIADHVREMSENHDLVFTSGGIGPTLDDVTYAGVASAFNIQLERHTGTINRMKEIRPSMELNDARLRMAELPEDCETLWTDGLWVPLAVVRNVYILPGIPKLFENMLQAIPIERFGKVSKRIRKVVLCDMKEGDLAQLLQKVADMYKELELGSYPATTEEAAKKYSSMITLEGDDGDDVSAAAELIKVGVNGRWEHL